MCELLEAKKWILLPLGIEPANQRSKNSFTTKWSAMKKKTVIRSAQRNEQSKESIFSFPVSCSPFLPGVNMWRVKIIINYLNKVATLPCDSWANSSEQPNACKICVFYAAQSKIAQSFIDLGSARRTVFTFIISGNVRDKWTKTPAKWRLNFMLTGMPWCKCTCKYFLLAV